MQFRNPLFRSHALTLAVALIAGCGGTTVAPNNRGFFTPTPPASPTPTPTPPPPSPAFTAQWTATVSSATNPNVGTMSISPSAEVSIQLTAAPASQAFNVQFCQFPSTSFNAMTGSGCFMVTTLTTSATGTAQTTFPFPQRGPFSGHFFFNTGIAQASDSLSTEASALTGTHTAQLVPMSTVNGGILADAVNTQDQLATGTLNAASGQVTITVTGSVANAVFLVAECNTATSSACQNVTTLTTDPTGNGSVTAAVQPTSGGSIFRLIQGTKTGGGFVSGFTVP